MYKITEVVFKPGSGLNCLGEEIEIIELADGSTREIVKNKNHAIAIGINDFAADPRNPTPAEITLGKQKISERLQTLLTESDADLLAENARLTARAQAAEQAAEQAKQAELQTERAARQLAESQKDAALAEVQKVRNEKFQSNVDPADNIPVNGPGPR